MYIINLRSLDNILTLSDMLKEKKRIEIIVNSTLQFKEGEELNPVQTV